MALNPPSRLNYDGYDPAWIIGSGEPPPVHPGQTMGTNRPVAAAPPSYASVQANGSAPGRGLPPHTQPLHHVQPNGSVPGRVLPHGQPHHHVQGEGLVPGTGLPHSQPHHQHVQISQAPSHEGGGGVPRSHSRQSHAQKIGKSILGFMSHSQVTGLGKPRSASYPRARHDVRSNPNPYLQPPPVGHNPMHVQQPAQRSAAHIPGVHPQHLLHVQGEGLVPGTGLPHTLPHHHVQGEGLVPGTGLPNTQPHHHVQREGLVPGTGLPHTQPHHQGLGQVKHVQISQTPSHGGVVVPRSHNRQSQAQKIGKSIFGFMAQSQVTGLGKPRSGSHPRPQRDVRSNPNPYLQPPPVGHTPILLQQPPLRSAAHVPGVHAPITGVHAPIPVLQHPPRSAAHGPAVHAHVQGPAQVPAISLRDVPVNAVVKVVMWVPAASEAAEKKWKDKITDIPGFQGFDVERNLQRVSVFGHVNPSVVLACMQKVVPRTQMWKQ